MTGMPRKRTGRLAMDRSGQTRQAPKSRKLATMRSMALIGVAGLYPLRRMSGRKEAFRRRGSDESAEDEIAEPFLELRGHRGGDLLRAPGTLGVGILAPALQVGVGLGGALAHRQRVDEVLEPRASGTRTVRPSPSASTRDGTSLPADYSVARHGLSASRVAHHGAHSIQNRPVALTKRDPTLRSAGEDPQ